MQVYIDLDSGTVFSGPVYVVEVLEGDIDAVMDNDETARSYALDYGKAL